MEIELFRRHLAQTPLMEPDDAIRLAFESAFGCGNLIPGAEKNIGWIRRQIERTPVEDVPPWTNIGNGLCRLNLASPEVRALGERCIYRMLRLTELELVSWHDTDLRYFGGLIAVKALAHKGETAFTVQQLDERICRFHDDGRRFICHSDSYCRRYHPSYRVVLTDLAMLIPVLRRDSKVIVFDGPCGSGKSTLAGWLARLLDTQPIPVDDFFLPPEMRTPERLSEPGGNMHRERFRAEVLEGLKKGGDVRWRRFDCSTLTYQPRMKPDSPVTVIEGSYSHHPYFEDMYRELGALRVFVDAAPAEQLRRIEKRAPEKRHMFETRWIPLEKTYFEAYDIRGSADVVINSYPRDAQTLYPE